MTKVLAYNDGHISWLEVGLHEGVLLQSALVGYQLVKIDSTGEVLVFESKHVQRLV